MTDQRDLAAQHEYADFRWLCRQIKRVVLGCGAVLFACALPTELPAPEVHRMLVGAGSHGGTGEATTLASLGPITRITYYLQNDSEHAQQMFAARLDTLRAHGLDALVVVHDFGRDTVAQMTALVRAFPGIVFQAGNEFDATGMTGTAYASLMQRITSANPHAHFVGMGLGSDNATVTRFTRAYRAASGPMLDAWCLHIYALPLSQAVTDRVRAASGSGMPIWLTEIGATGSDTEQATQLQRGLQAARDAGVARVFVYQLQDKEYGLQRVDRTRRPAFGVVQTFTGGWE